MSTDSPAPERAERRAEPQSLRCRSLSVSLTVDDLEESLAWYRDVVGFTLERMIEREGEYRGAVVKAGVVRFLLNQDDGARGWDRSKGEGFSLQLTTVQDVDELARRIVERGGELASEPADMPWGARLFRLVDPSGFKLVISADIEAASGE